MIDRERKKIIGVHFPNLYLWLVFLSALDVVLTRVILYFGGVEVNPLADLVIKHGGQMGMSVFKFTIVAFVIIVCEYAARLDVKTAKRLAVAGCLITAIPVVWSSCLVIEMIVTFQPGMEPEYPHGLDDVFDRKSGLPPTLPSGGGGP